MGFHGRRECARKLNKHNYIRRSETTTAWSLHNRPSVWTASVGNDGSHVHHERGIGAINNYSGVVMARLSPKRHSIRRIYEVCSARFIARSKRQNIRVNYLYSSLGPTG